MEGPYITRLADGTIKKHWTIESAEAAARAERERRAAKIRAMRAPARTNIFSAVWSHLVGAIHESPLNRFRRTARPHPERL